MSLERTINNSLDDIVETELDQKTQEHTDYVNLLMGIDGADKATLSAMSTEQLINLADRYTTDGVNVTAQELGITKPTTLHLETGATSTADTTLVPESIGIKDRVSHIYTGALARVITRREESLASGKNKLDGAKEALKERRFVRGLSLGVVGVASTIGVVGTTALLSKAFRTEINDLFDGLNVDEARADTAGDSTPPEDDTSPSPTPEDENANYLRSESHKGDRMSTEGMFDSDSNDRSNAEADRHVLEKIKNNPSLAASVLEVRESGHMDSNFSLDEVNKDTKTFSVSGENGEYSAKGEKAVETLEKSWENGEQGKILSDDEVRKIQEKYVLINHGTDEGEFKNAIDDTTYDAGVFDYRPELGDKIYEKELGNGRTVYFKVNEKDSSRDCLNVVTTREKTAPAPEVILSQGHNEVHSPQENLVNNPVDNPQDTIQVEDSVSNLPQEQEEEEEQQGDDTPSETPPQDTPNNSKGTVVVDSQGPANTGGVTATGPGPVEQQQQAGGQTTTQAEQQAGGGTSGSTQTAAGAETVTLPANPAPGAQGQTSGGTVSE